MGGSSAVSPKTSRGGATARAFCVGLWFSAGRGGLLGAVTCREQGWCRRTSRSASPSLTRESQCTWALRAPSLHARASLSRTAARRRALQARDLPSPRTEMAMGQRGIRAPGDSVGRRAARVQIAPLGTGQSWHATHSQSALLLSPHARQRDRRIEEWEKFAHNHARWRRVRNLPDLGRRRNRGRMSDPGHNLVMRRRSTGDRSCCRPSIGSRLSGSMKKTLR